MTFSKTDKTGQKGCKPPANPLHTPCKPPAHIVTHENVQTPCKPPANPPNTPCVHTPHTPIGLHTPLKGGGIPQGKVIEGLTFLLKQHGFDATVSVRNGFSVDLSSKKKCMPDAALLATADFDRLLAGIHSIDELNGLANRRRHLRNQDLQRWSEQQRQAIIHRKYQLEQEQKK